MKFRVELWRIVKFLLITAAVDGACACIGLCLRDWLVSRGMFTIKLEDSLIGGLAALSSVALVVLHRCFTFRASHPLHTVALALMVGSFIWWGSAVPTVFDALSQRMADAVWLMAVLSALWSAICYVVQRYAFYRQSTDTNRWFTLFHPTNDEKGD